MRPVNVVTSLMCHLKRPLRYGGYLRNQIQSNNFVLSLKRQCSPMCWWRKLFRALCSRVIWHDISKHLLRCDHSVTISQRSVSFRNGVVYILCVMYSLIIHFGITQYELLLHMYHLSVLPQKQHNIQLIVSRQICIPMCLLIWPMPRCQHQRPKKRDRGDEKA